MWVISEKFVALDLEPLDAPETRSLNRTPFVQNKIDECLPPLVSNRIYQCKKIKLIV